MDASLFDRALALGFDFVTIGEILPCARWGLESAQDKDPHWSGLYADPRALLSQADRVVILLKAYAPYEYAPDEAYLSSYYLCSNEAFYAARGIAEFLRERGYASLQTERFPYKATAALLGIGTYLRNGLIERAPFGARFVLQMILTDAPLKAAPSRSPSPAFLCRSCGLCERACPTSALKDGRIAMDRCLRALQGGAVIPEALRPLIGANLLGCELCQNTCPQNANIKPVPMPQSLRAALDLKRLLRGEVAPLADLIGKNYARKKQTQARACLIAANLRRKDCLPLIKSLADDDFPAVREHARWAAERL